MSDDRDDPFSRGGKTVIRPNPGGRVAPRPDAAPWRPPGAAPEGPAHNPRVTSGYESTEDTGAPGMPRAEDDWLAGPSPMRQRTPDPQPAPASTPKIPLDVALNARDGTAIASANPLTAAAGPLLILLGRLRMMVIEVEARPLMEHVANRITAFEKDALAAGADAHDVAIAKYALCGTADDIVQNLPGSDKHVWLQYSMVAQFFQRRTSGVGFYTELNRILQNPAPQYDLLELLHACLSMGFEGQYRGAPNGASDLSRIRRDVYETLRRLRARSDDEISPHWRGLDLKAAKPGGRVPLPAVAAASAALAVAVFFLLRILLGNTSDGVTERLLALNPATQLTLERAAFTVVALPDYRDQTQLERIRAALAEDIAAGGVTVDAVGDAILVRVSNVLLFDSGKTNVKDGFAPLAQHIAAALDKEPGPISIVGHTDNVKPARTSRFKSNQDLSVARATSVQAELEGLLTDPARTVVEGRGDLEPVADNGTADGRALNRRVEIMIPREETLKT